MRYIIDVTQLVHWPGNLTGIPRVMHELSMKFLEKYPDNTIFVSWVKETGAMCEIDFEDTISHRGAGITYKYQNQSTPSGIITTKSITTSKRILKKIATKTKLDSNIVYRKASRRLNQEMTQSYVSYTPESGDKLFIPWGEWWDSDWLKLMGSFSSLGVELFPICHDTMPMVIPQFSGNSASLQDFVKQVFPVSKTILTPSKSSKKDLSAWMKDHNLTIPKIEVFRLGEDFAIKEADDASYIAVLEKYKVDPNDYLVFVSTIEPRKNHAILYYTYKLAASRGIKLPKLLIIGRVGHNTSEIIHLFNEDPDVNKLVKICNNVSDDELHVLYDNCKFSVQTSFYEGWGMSVVESISKGKPVVCSNTSSLKEMPTESIIFFNPSSTDECLNAIMRMNSPKTLKSYTAAAKNYKLHSWDKSFDQVMSIINGDK